MSNNIGKYLVIGAVASLGAGMVYLSHIIKRDGGLIFTTIELEGMFEELYTKHGDQGMEELIKEYTRRTKSFGESKQKSRYREILTDKWDKFIQKKNQKGVVDV